MLDVLDELVMDLYGTSIVQTLHALNVHCYGTLQDICCANIQKMDGTSKSSVK